MKKRKYFCFLHYDRNDCAYYDAKSVDEAAKKFATKHIDLQIGKCSHIWVSDITITKVKVSYDDGTFETVNAASPCWFIRVSRPHHQLYTIEELGPENM